MVDFSDREGALEVLGRYEKAKRRKLTSSWLRGKKVRAILADRIDLLNPREDNSVYFDDVRLMREWGEEDPWIQEKLENTIIS